MVEIRPFKAIRYTKKAGDLENLVAEPYDKIDERMQNEYYAKSPYNFCRVILPKETDRYNVAKKRIHDWLTEKILAKDGEPAFFVSRQQFELNNRPVTRTGLIVASRLHSFNENKVFPHEVTYSAPKADRLSMLRTLQKDLEPVFLIYSDEENITIDFFARVARRQPLAQVKDSLNVEHTLWMVTDPNEIKLLKKALDDKIFIITDGHHRYESAIAYRDEMRKQHKWTEDSAFNFHMSYIVPFQEEGLIVLPTHRLLRKCSLNNNTLHELAKFFKISDIDSTPESADAFLADHKNEHAFCIYEKRKTHGLLLKDEKSVLQYITAGCKESCLLDVVLLRDLIFKHIFKTGELKLYEDISYARWTKEAIGKVDKGEANVAFLLNPVSPETVWRIAQKRERLPEKSTDFYPKMVSGLMMMGVSPNEEL
jgi:uncharacterized protein (DUF1015 family)